MRVVGRDATLMAGRDGTDTSYLTNTINFNAGESFDVIVDAPRSPAAPARAGGYDVYMLYNRNFLRANNLAPGGFGGQATEIRVYPTMPPSLSKRCRTPEPGSERTRNHDAANRFSAASEGNSRVLGLLAIGTVGVVTGPSTSPAARQAASASSARPARPSI